ncbi:hypothetical protein KJ564_00525 [bacterium]|nr:hypothetical protein [bacterium]
MTNRSTQKPSLGSVLVIPLGFISLALLCCQVGYLTPAFSRAAGAAIWLVAVLLSGSPQRFWWLLISALLLFNPWGAVHRPEGLWLLFLLPWSGGIYGKRWMGAAFIVAIIGTLLVYFPQVWAPIDDLVAALTGLISISNLSASAAGLPLLGIALAMTYAALFTEKTRLSAIIITIILWIVWFIYLLLVPHLPRLLNRWGVFGFHDAFSMQWLLLITLAIVLLVWSIIHQPVVEARKVRGRGVIVPVLAAIGFILLAWPPQVDVPQKDKTVLFYDRGYLNWDIPQYGVYGRRASGMFGLAPDYLRWKGFQVERTDTLTQELLNRSGLLTIINLVEAFSPEEESMVHRWVEDGGSLLLLGDHTGLANIRAPSNSLLQPYGIELNFDSAKPKRTGWAGSLVTTPHPLTAGLGLQRQGGDKPGVTHIWVGASLKLKSPAKPLIMGRDGFSDIGNPKNEKDGFLGDYRYRIDERLGNQALLAEAHTGKGKALVFGDTSTLQNGAMVRSGPFVERVFNYLLAPVTPVRLFVRFAGLILLLGAVLAWGLSRGSFGGLFITSILLFGLNLHFNCKLENRLESAGPGGWSDDAFPIALIDHSHAPRTPLNHTSDQGVWGLQNCLMRSRFLPQSLEKWDTAALDHAALLIETAPAAAFSRKEQADLADFMLEGGLLVLCCGYEEYDGSKSILKELQIEPLYVPLGPAEAATEVELPAIIDSVDTLVTKPLTVKFHKAWEISVTNPNARILLEYEERPVMVFLPIGNGGVVYIPDTEFLTNRNLETPAGEYFEENILYLRWLLREFAGGD